MIRRRHGNDIGTDRVAFITGAASGIGYALARAWAERGARVVMTDIDLSGVEHAAHTITTSHAQGTATGTALDVRDPDRFAHLIDATLSTHGRLDYLVNNAGTAVAGLVEDLTAQHWNDVIDVNLHGTINGVRAAYPHLIRQGHGHIVNIASAAGLLPMPLLTPYATTKFGIVGLSLSLRAEAAPRGVRVTAICPGAVETPFLDRQAPTASPTPVSAPNVRRFVTADLGAPACPDDLARAVLRAVHRNTAILAFPTKTRLAWLAMRTCPTVVLPRHHPPSPPREQPHLYPLTHPHAVDPTNPTLPAALAARASGRETDRKAPRPVSV